MGNLIHLNFIIKFKNSFHQNYVIYSGIVIINYIILILNFNLLIRLIHHLFNLINFYNIFQDFFECLINYL